MVKAEAEPIEKNEIHRRLSPGPAAHHSSRHRFNANPWTIQAKPISECGTPACSEALDGGKDVTEEPFKTLAFVYCHTHVIAGHRDTVYSITWGGLLREPKGESSLGLWAIYKPPVCSYSGSL